jgi:AraC-like DNA-binding protein
MPATLRGIDPDRLERSCNSIRFGAGAEGVERAEVHLSTCAFEPHRHDTYAVGITTAGVQQFRYRGARRVCLPGQVHFLYPDELHDGGAGTPDGFGYRIVYLEPSLLRAALGGSALPFITDPVHDLTPATHPLTSVLDDIDEPIGELGRAEIATTVADVLVSLSGRPPRRTAIALAAVERVRERLASCPREPAPAGELERIAGIDRFAIARHFRWAFGTSPDRYRTLRRLALARSVIERGMPLAAAAAEAGFADQSHMTRQFKRAYGMTPARWAEAIAAGEAVAAGGAVAASGAGEAVAAGAQTRSGTRRRSQRLAQR